MSDKKLNSYYLYYSQVLKKKELTNDQLIEQMKTRFGNGIEIRIDEWGRTRMFNSLIISKDSLVKYVVPLISPQELALNQTLGQKLLVNYNWVVPPYIQMGIIYEMITKTESSDIEELYSSVYDSHYFSLQITSLYSEIPLFKPYISLIEEAISSFLLKNIASSITLLFTVIEGISREFCHENDLKYNIHGSTSPFEIAVRYRKEQWKDKVLFFDSQKKTKIILPDDYLQDEVLINFDEALDMYVTFEKYGLDLYKSGSDFSLNRHSILHGYNKDYFIKTNFFRLFSCLEMIALVSSNRFMAKVPSDLEPAYQLYEKFRLYEEVSRKINKGGR